MNSDVEIEKKIDLSGLKKELEQLGVSRYIIEQKHIRNLYMAKRIVEGYDFGRELTQEEKKALIQSIVDKVQLDKNVRRYISTLMLSFQEIGLSEQEIFGTIINLGVNGTVLENAGAGYEYTNLLANKNDACRKISQYKDSMKKSVGEMTILTALSINLNEQEEQQLKQELEDLGISKEFIRQKYSSNLYIAKTIVERYSFQRELISEEKKELIKAILKSSRLSRRKKSLATLMQRFEQMGLGEQEIYGVIINLGVNGIVVEEKGCGYSELLMNSNNACEKIASHIGEIQTEVTEDAIQKALNKAEKVMKKAVKHQKEKGEIGSQSSTRVQLINLVRGEQVHEMRADANPR